MNKEQIDEIAMAVWNETESECDSRTGRQIITGFAHALLAELAKKSEPLAEIDRKVAGYLKLTNTLEFSRLPDGTKLFTAPLPQPDLVAEIEHLKRSRENFAQSSEHSLQQLSAAQADNDRLVQALEECLGWLDSDDPFEHESKTSARKAIAAHKARNE